MKKAYIICHTFHDMYTLEDKPVIDEVYESKEDADKRVRELWSECPNSDYYIEESELYSMVEPEPPKKVLDVEALRYERTLRTMSGTELSAVAYILGKFAYVMGLDQDKAREKMHKILDRYLEDNDASTNRD